MNWANHECPIQFFPSYHSNAEIVEIRVWQLLVSDLRVRPAFSSSVSAFRQALETCFRWRRTMTNRFFVLVYGRENSDFSRGHYAETREAGRKSWGRDTVIVSVVSFVVYVSTSEVAIFISLTRRYLPGQTITLSPAFGKNSDKRKVSVASLLQRDTQLVNLFQDMESELGY
jgi:hypothetical protein